MSVQFCGCSGLRLSLLAAAILLLSPARLVGAPEPRIAALFDRMTRATLAGDIDGYLTCVDRDDPIFWKEQQNWAADFKRHVPREFSFTFDPDELKVEDGTASVPITIAWTMADAGARPRHLTYTAVLTEHDGEWMFAGEKWERLDGPGVRVLFAEGLGETAQRVADLLPDIRTHVDEGFGIHIERVQEVKLYGSMRHLQESIYLSYTDPLSGWNEPGESIKLLVGRRTGASGLKPLLAHEYGHVATFELGPKANEMQWWILEGVAELSAERYGSAEVSKSTVRAWARRDRLLPWDRLSDFHTVKDADQGHVYTQGHHMIGFISERYGRDGRNRWLTAMATGKTIDEATQEVMATDFAALDAQWRNALAAEVSQEAPAGPE